MPRQTADPGIPPLWNVRRVIVCTGLILIGIVQTLGAIALSSSAAALLTGAKNIHGLPVAPALVAAALTGFVSFVVQHRTAERFALSYVHDVRVSYARHVLLLPFDGKSPELGLSLTRLVNDLGAVKLWLSRGLLALVTLAASLLTLTLWLALAERSFLVPLVSCLALWTLGIALALAPLRKSIRRSRQKRGRLAVLLGRALPERLPLLMHGKLAPVTDRLTRTSTEVCNLLVTRATWSSAMRALSRATFPCAAGVFALTEGIEGGKIALFLLIFAFVSTQLESGAAGLEFFEAYRVARDKLQRVFNLPTLAPFKTVAEQVPDWQKSIEIVLLELPSGEKLSAGIEGGACTRICRDNTRDLRHIALSLSGLTRRPSQERILIDGVTFADIGRKSLWRNVALLSPENGIPAYQKNRPAFLFGARRDPCGDEQAAVRSSLGLDEDWTAGVTQKMPESERVRIRIARALLRKPKLLIVHDDSLSGNDCLALRLQELATDHGTTLVILAKNDPS